MHWAAQMAVGLDTKVPWVMCQQKDAPDPIVSTHIVEVQFYYNGNKYSCRWPGVNSTFHTNCHTSYNIACRSTHAMDFIAIISSQTLSTSPKYGQKIGLDGKIS